MTAQETDPNGSAPSTSSYKVQGNEYFRQGLYLKAAATYTKALKEDPNDAVLYSNRCASLLKLTKLTKALADADAAIRLRPEWDKGHFRRGAVLEALQRGEEALASYQEALRLSPANREITEKIRNLNRVIKSQQRSPSKQQQQAGGTAANGAPLAA